MAEDSEIAFGTKTEAWNFAQGYIYMKLLRHLIDMDKYVILARYGVEQIENTTITPPEVKTFTRIEAIRRLIDCLRLVVENAEFAMNNSKTKEVMDRLSVKVTEVESVISGVSREVSDQRTGEKRLEINEDHFNVCLESLRQIKTDIPKPLNSQGLIFPISEEVDFDTIEKKLIFGG